MLIGLGFSPLTAAVICLVANTPPVPFGPVGVPTNMMISVTQMKAGPITRAIGMDMALLALIIPFFMLVVMTGWKKTFEVWPAPLAAGVSYAITCYLCHSTLGAELPADPVLIRLSDRSGRALENLEACGNLALPERSPSERNHRIQVHDRPGCEGVAALGGADDRHGHLGHYGLQRMGQRQTLVRYGRQLAGSGRHRLPRRSGGCQAGKAGRQLQVGVFHWPPEPPCLSPRSLP